jgi:hypothetical protein
MFEFNSMYGEGYGELGPAIIRHWSFLSDSTPEEEVERALALFRSLQVTS